MCYADQAVAVSQGPERRKRRNGLCSTLRRPLLPPHPQFNRSKTWCLQLILYWSPLAVRKPFEITTQVDTENTSRSSLMARESR
jgi:hypothetical protein